MDLNLVQESGNFMLFIPGQCNELCINKTVLNYYFDVYYFVKYESSYMTGSKWYIFISAVKASTGNSLVIACKSTLKVPFSFSNSFILAFKASTTRLSEITPRICHNLFHIGTDEIVNLFLMSVIAYINL